ncbi:hypothetical protein GCM10022221_18100 [Actinocorallia aurea]
MTTYETRPGPGGNGAGLAEDGMPDGRFVTSSVLPIGLIEQARQLVEDVASQSEREERARIEGYTAGVRDGIDIGAERERQRQERAGAMVWKAVQAALPSGPSHAELERVRYPGYTPERLRELREAARERIGIPHGGRARWPCGRCEGRGWVRGGGA